MPESSGNIVEIHNSLKASLGRGHSDLDQDVVAASKRVLLENIVFQPASAPYTMQRDALKAKYISLNPVPVKWEGEKAQQQKEQTSKFKAMSSQSSIDKNGNDDGLPTPKIILFPEEKVKMEWTRMTRIGAGLVNMGNTCFFNSTLQCLTYTAPLVNYCLSNDHREKCKKKEFCMMCEIQSHIKSSLDCGGRSIKPHSMLQKLRSRTKCILFLLGIAKHMKWGRQEDAHEFLRFVVDHLQQSCLNGESKLDQLSKDTTVINQIFGGYLRSQVTCLRCHAKSNTFDPFMDISLDIKGVNTVEDALAKFVKPETLEQENAYKCPNCKHKVRAQKRFSIQKAPNVLTLQLNRFDFHRHLSGKITRFIKYPEKINLRNYMSQRQDEPILYHLYGVLVHSGHSSEHGHYYSYVKSPSKTWYCMNDSVVHQAAYNNVFNADAYVLFYARIKTNSSSNGMPSAYSGATQVKGPSSPSKVPFIGPTLPNHLKPGTSSTINGIPGKPTSELGTPIKRQEASFSQSAVNNGPKILPHITAGGTLPGVHNKISFPILTVSQKKLLQQQQDDGKRIVLQIKHGNSTTMEKSPDGKSKVVNGGLAPGSGLVPYNSDSDSEQENASCQGSKPTTPNSLAIKTIQVDGSSTSASIASSSCKPSGDFHHHQVQVKKINFPMASGDAKNMSEKANSAPIKGHATLASSDPLPSTSHHKPSTSNSSVTKLEEPLKHSSELSQTNSLHKDNQHSFVDTSHAPGKGSLVTMELPVVNVSSSTTSNCAKVRATGGNWLIQSQDCAPSPRGSCSSSNSVNSTTEWTVESKEMSFGARHGDNGLVKPVFMTTDLNILETVNQSKDIMGKKLTGNLDSKSCKKDSTTKGGISLPLPDKLHSSSSSSSQASHVGSKKKKHKKKSRKSHYDDDDDDMKKRGDYPKKKKKHKKKEKNKERRDAENSASDSEGFKRHKKHKHLHSSSSSYSSSDDGKKKSSYKESESEDGYEWVEKTKETAGVINAVKSSFKASVQSWDHHIKDDLATKKDSHSVKLKSNWDGTRVPKLAANLEGSSFTFGSNVLSWEGGKNNLDSEDRSNKSKKRHWSDLYNQEIDAGKTKKVKKVFDNTFPTSNPFQDYHSDKARDSATSWKQDHSYHQHHRRDRNSSTSWTNH
ncbi:unnamed protein product [Lymnaea stagnalis]|uniref:Ubiquitin carboxyl-terminal hydrolase 36 n=1 Tax=Lymnaea stagnalis TaxID=6523 RepID=A0AAV2I1J7_LYMST